MYRKTIRAGEISRKRHEVAHGRGRTIQVPLYVDFSQIVFYYSSRLFDTSE